MKALIILITILSLPIWLIIFQVIRFKFNFKVVLKRKWHQSKFMTGMRIDFKLRFVNVSFEVKYVSHLNNTNSYNPNISGCSK